MMSFDFKNYDDLFVSPPKKTKEITPKSVSEISNEIKSFIEGNFNKVCVKGEIFGAKRADSGHWYLSLKDENAVLSAVCWKSTASSLKIRIEDGLEVIAKGKITTFAGKSTYQLVIDSITPAGEGALLKLLEERKLQFLKEGLFSEEHKKPLPFLPETIGVVTSQSGAVIRDIIHRVKDRFPSHILLWPTPVQGIGAAEKIAQAIRGFNNLPQNGKIKRPDVIIVARGGGSLEDLWAFNEECVVRAVYDSDIPIISAVGHETDTMLIDYVADKRAPTPTGATEFAVPVQSELLYTMDVFDNRLKNSINRYISELKSKIEGLNRGIPNLKEILNENTQKLDYRIERLDIAMKNFLTIKQNLLNINDVKPIYIKTITDKYKERLLSLYYRLEGVSVDSVLKRGFAWVKGDKNQTIYNLKDANNQKNLTIEFIDGKIKVAPDTKKDKNDNLLFDF